MSGAKLILVTLPRVASGNTPLCVNTLRIRACLFDALIYWLQCPRQIDASSSISLPDHRYGPEKAHKLELVHSPLKLSFLRNEVSQIVLNERGLFHMEHYRARPDPFPSPKGEGEEQAAEGLVFQDQGRAQAFLGKEDAAAWAGFEEQDSGEWEESWSGKPDSKPKGPEGLSLDITFPGYEHVFGIPEHASPLSLRSTRGERDGDFTDPYRLMNTDVFEYDYDSPMALYGSVPLMHAQAPGSSVAIFWLSGSETWIDIQKRPSKLSPTPKMGEGGSSGVDTHTHWMSESGILDLFIYLGPTAEKNLELFTGMVGRTALPQLFAIGYHQCRWNYLTTDDVLNVDAKFDEEDVSCLGVYCPNSIKSTHRRFALFASCRFRWMSCGLILSTARITCTASGMRSRLTIPKGCWMVLMRRVAR